MSFSDEMTKELEKLKKKINQIDSQNLESPYAGGNSRLHNDDDDIAPLPDSWLNRAASIPDSAEGVAEWRNNNSKKEEKKKSGGIDLFDAGAFSDYDLLGEFRDGYDFGDVTKTILGLGTATIKTVAGTAADVGLNAAEGFTQAVEGLVDLGSYGVAGVADLFGADEWADTLKKKTAVSQTDMLLGKASDYLDEYSLLGRSTEGAVQVLGQQGLNAVTGGLGKFAGMATQGLSQMGSGIGEAYQGGGTDSEAFRHGLDTGIQTAIWEALFAGMGKAVKGVGLSKGVTGLDDKVATAIGKLIKSPKARNIAEWAVKSGFEGLEELGEGFTNAVSKKLTYMSEEDFGKILEDENLLEQFVVGALGSGMMQSGYVPGTYNGSVRDANKSGKDFVTGLTANEQSVVDKIYKDRIAEAEKNGKVTNKAKNKIYDDILTELDKGYISTDTIEEVLGGDTYKSYQDTVKSEDALQAEFDELRKVKTSESTLEQNDRYNELKKQLDELKTTSERSFLEKKYKSEAFEIAKGDRLIESYNERARRGQAFEADVSQYKGKARQTIENLINSKSVNNTNRTHEFADSLAKYSEDQDVVVEFTNNAQLKADKNNHKLLKNFTADGNTKVFDLKMKNIDDDYAPVVTVNGEAVTDFKVDYKNGTITFAEAPKGDVSVEYRKVSLINGYRKGDKLVLNMDSPQAWTFTVGHEVTHTLEGTKEYDEYRKAIIQWAKDKGDYDSRFESRKNLYNDGTDIDGEITADLTGEYILNDVDFIQNLATNHQNVFQKIYNEIKHMLKLVTAGSKEARQLERAKHNFEKAYRASAEAKSQADVDSKMDGSDTVQHSMKVTDEETIEFLENQEHITTYKAMQVIDGKLYPPMAAKVKDANGKYQLTNPSEIGVWQQATEDPTNIKKFKNGVGYYTLNKGNGKSLDAAYNPYEHSSNLVLNDQFEEAYNRPNIVTVECVIPASEMTSGYKAEHAKDGTGLLDWKAGTVASKLKNNQRKVYLSRWLKPVRILSDAETASMYKDIVGDVAVPFNVVPPGLLTELEKAGVNIDYEGSPNYKSHQKKKADTQYSMNDGIDEFLQQPTNTLEKFGNSWYNDKELDLSPAEKQRVQSEALTWNAGKRNQPITQTLSNGTTYQYVIDDDGIVHIYEKEQSVNIHDLGEDYGNTNTTQLDSITEELWAGQRDNSIAGSHSQDGRGSRKDDTNDNSFVSGEGRSNGTGNSKNRTNGYVKPKKRHFHFNDDGSTEVTYSDGSKEILDIAPTKEASSTDGVFFDGKNKIQHSLSDSDGNALSDGQKEFFKDSKAVDRNGNLLKVYHTTKNDFTVFDDSKKGTTTEGYNTYLGHFFTDNPDYMSEFPDFKGGKTEAYYLNMKNPIDMNNISREAFLDIVEVTGGDVTEAAEVYDTMYAEEVERAKFRNGTPALELSNLLEELTGEYFFDTEFHDALRPNYDKLIAKGYDGVINNMDGAGWANEYVVLNSNQAKLTTNTNPTSDPDVRYSLSEDTEGRSLSEGQQDYFRLAQTRDEQGRLKPFYHGTRRADRVGTYFDPKRATSGPMAYFTDSREIAEHYAKDKADTSLAYDSDYDSYETQFRVNRNGKDMSVVDLWNTLSFSERNAIKEKAKHVTMDDDFDSVVYNEDEQHGLGNFDAYELNRHKGNALHTLVDSWLTDGNIYGEERKFLDVLRLVGIEDAVYKDPDFRDEKTYEVYLNITNPFDTSNISDEMIEAFKRAAEAADYAPGNSADMWDKTNVTPEKWIEGLLDDIENGTTYTWTRIPDFVTDVLKGKGFDGIFDTGGKQGGEVHTVAIPFYSEQIKSVDNQNPTDDLDIMRSLTDENDTYGRNGTSLRDLRVEGVAPVQEEVAPVTETVQDTFSDDYAPMVDDEYAAQERLESLTDEDAPPEIETSYYEQRDTGTIADEALKEISERVSGYLGLSRSDRKALEGIIQNYSQNENLTRDDLYSEMKDKFSVIEEVIPNEETRQVKKHLRGLSLYVSDAIKGDFSEGRSNGYAKFLRSNFGKLKIVKDITRGVPVDSAYMELSDLYPSYFPEDIINPADQLRNIAEVANMPSEDIMPFELSDEEIQSITDMVYADISEYMNDVRLQTAIEQSYIPHTDEDAPAAEPETENKVLSVRELYDQKLNNYKETLAAHEAGRAKSLANFNESIGQKVDEYNALKNKNTKRANTLLQQIENLRLRRDNVQADYANRIAKQQARVEAFESKDYSEFENKVLAIRRKDYHKQIVENAKAQFEAQGYDLDEVLKNAKDLSTFSTVDNIPQRVMEKALGWKEGHILSDITVNKVAQNETEGIKWLNTITDRKNGLLAQLVKDYGIKPGSKESAAAQMYAEGFYVNKNNDIVKYGDAELSKDFPDSEVRKNIKALSKDQRIRNFYDETLKAINESRARNAYPEIPKLANYFLHFRAMEDTFSRLGLPFNPNDIRAKDLPTDLNGVTADLKPGQPYFASSMHRTGQRTSFDLLGGLEKYATSAKNQIYHIDDIQTLRAIRNYVADTYGQAKGLENLDALSEEEVQERIKDVYGSHLSTFAKFLNEEANVLAGKTALIDRGLEGIVGRRAMTFMDTVNRQVGSNMVGYNISSALTNLVAPVQAFAKTNKAAFIKGFAQTVANKVNSIKGKSDGFAETSPVVIRRKGSDRFYRTAWEKFSDPGYALMGAVDDFSTELIARAKYNELTQKGMDSETAHVETDKWVSRLMGDRSLGQMPQLYNSKMLGLVTKFQLEVRNQLDSQFYDTIQEAKASTEDIQNGLERNAKKAAKITSTLFTLAVGQHLFGKAFESIAGYNPAFDIISVLIKTLGFDDEEDSEDTILDNIEQGFFELMGDMPYTSILEGGRIPISSALPIEQLYKGTDQYGNEKSRWETIKETLPYYLMPGGYGQLKKTTQGLGMFDDEHPVAGSYTDSGKLRFPVEDTFANRLQAGIFGQYASENARDYFDNERKALDEKQIQEFVDSGISIQDYWEYREGLSGLKTLNEKANYIYSLDLPIEVKNLFINNLSGRKEAIDLSGMGEYDSFQEYDFASQNPEKYEWLKENGITVAEYEGSDKETKEEYNYAFKYPQKYAFLQDNGVSFSDYINGSEEFQDAYTWAFNNPEKYKMSKAVADDIMTYWQYTSDLYDIKADKDSDGKSISGSRKEKVIDYINNLDADYGQKIILFKSEYPADDTYNYDIIDYLNGRDDISYEEMNTILKELGFTVKGNQIYWD